MIFRDRSDAGRQLARLLAMRREVLPVVIALPRGGVPVAYEIARSLRWPLDVFVVRKLGAPFQHELGIGALAEDGTVIIDPLAARLDIDQHDLAAVIAEETEEAGRRVRRFRAGRPAVDVAGRTVILVDDGVATGGTARVALRCLRAKGAAKLVLATPVAAPDAIASLRADADDVVCLQQPDDFRAVGLWYADFHQVADEEVIACLEAARAEQLSVGAPRTTATQGRHAKH